MPRFVFESLVATPRLTLDRVACDGCDAPRPREEVADADGVMLALHGRFEVRHAAGRVIVDPTRGLLLRAGAAYTVRHPDGGDDACLSVLGTVLAHAEPARDGSIQIDAQTQLGLAQLACAAEPHVAEPLAADDLAAEEVLATALATRPPRVVASAADRALAHHLGHLLAARVDEPLSLAALAREVGCSAGHASHAFRRATGQSLHAARLELRLRHALALLLDTAMSLADIAAHTGFASQSHLTNRFRRRFGRAPGQWRRGLVERGAYLVPNRRSPASPRPGTM